MRTETQPATPDAPEHLSERARGLWQEITAKQVFCVGRLALFRTALEALDRADEARALIAEQGLTQVTESAGAVYGNPMLKVERESRALFAKLWGDLGLGWDHQLDGWRDRL